MASDAARARQKAYLAEWSKNPVRKAKMVEYRRNRRTQFKAELVGIKTESGCVDCGEKDVQVLEFHHVEEANKVAKKKGMNAFINANPTRPKFDKEVAKCVILCDPCHVRRHVQMRKEN